jgi:hypothetical protein
MVSVKGDKVTKINGGKATEYYDGFKLDKIASDIFNRVAMF